MLKPRDEVIWHPGGLGIVNGEPSIGFVDVIGT
jgi:hypothetical protein